MHARVLVSVLVASAEHRGSTHTANHELARRIAIKRQNESLESREKLEQLRALEANMSIAVVRVDSVPLSVDTPADLEKARAVIAASVK